MQYYKFSENDIFINTIRTYPLYEFYIYNSLIYFDNSPRLQGANNMVNSINANYISLYEYNIDRSSDYIYPFLIKGNKRDCFKTITKEDYTTQFQKGDVISSSYMMSASISRYYYAANSTRRRVVALKNAYKDYNIYSPHFQYSSSFGDKNTQTLNLISIPSILYGSSIKKGSVCLKYYITGTLVGELSDHKLNGELIQTGPVGSTGSGSVAGVIMYTEGIISLTGAWSLDSTSIQYDSTDTSKWIYFGYGANDGNSMNSTSPTASFYIGYSGSHDIQTLTMLTKAPYDGLNYSNNPTFISASEKNIFSSGRRRYVETADRIKNTADYAFTDTDPPENQSIYISSVNLYDEDKNLIGTAKLAKPIRKTKDRQYTFKLKLDI